MSFSKVARAYIGDEVTHLSLKEIRQPVDPEAQEELDREKLLQEKLARLESEIALKDKELQEVEAAFRASLEVERDHFYQELAKEKETVLREAVSEGVKKGNQEGLDAWTEKIQQANLILETSMKESHDYLGSSETTILNLALAISEKIVGQQLEQTEAWQALVKQAIREMRETSPIKILVSPERVTSTREALDQLKEITYGSDILIFSDPELSPTDCLVESPSGRLDASVSTQLNQLKKALTELLRSPSHESR
ncbi:MAG TPA: FliH/SctL family protein [Candidatus Angelobacter sp.]|nr:FliH/SctL family protein [Candidatus Angelobacter sp.]